MGGIGGPAGGSRGSSICATGAGTGPVSIVRGWSGEDAASSSDGAFGMSESFSETFGDPAFAVSAPVSGTGSGLASLTALLLAGSGLGGSNRAGLPLADSLADSLPDPWLNLWRISA